MGTVPEAPINAAELASTRLAAGMSDEQREYLASVLEPRLYADGELIVHSQDREVEYSLLVIVSGEASVLGSFDQEVGNLHTGSLIGEMSFLDSRPRSASVVSAKGTRCANLSHETWERLQADRPDVALHIMKNLAYELCEKMRRSSRLIDALSIASV